MTDLDLTNLTEPGLDCTGLDQTEWRDIGTQLAAADIALPWMLADFLVHGEQHFHDGLMQAVEVLDHMSHQRIGSLLFLGQRFPPDRRRHADTLSASMFEAVMRLDTEDAEQLLDQAAAEGWNRDELRDAVRQHNRQLRGQDDTEPACTVESTYWETFHRLKETDTPTVTVTAKQWLELQRRRYANTATVTVNRDDYLDLAHYITKQP